MSKGKVVGGVAWGMGGAAGQALFQLAIFIVLARTLSPAAFGVVAIATALIDILNFVGRGGITEILVQRRELDARTMNAGFFASVISGAGLTILLWLLAPALARAFAAPELWGVMTMLAPICLLYAAGAVYEGILRHAFQFKQLALRNASSTVASGLVALVLALNDFGAYALVAQRLVATVWSLLAMIAATRWLPRFDFDVRDMAGQLRQGSAIMLSSVLGFGNQRIVDLVVGYFLGPVQLGYLRIAWRMLDLLVEIVVRPVNSVSLTSLPKAMHEGRSVADEYATLLRYSSVAIVPMFVGFAAVAQDVVPLVFGAKWERSAQLLTLLCFVGVFMPLTYFKSSPLIAHGQYRKVFWLNLAEFALSVGLTFIFAPFGLVSATIGNVVRSALAVPVSAVFLERTIGIPAWQTIRAVIPAVFAALCMLAATYGVRDMLPAHLPALLRLCTVICAGMVVYCAALLLADRKLLADARQVRVRA